jgi:tRNA threonylcarbamoyladenosine modification (KEOPS) complex Cgi121 subunit
MITERIGSYFFFAQGFRGSRVDDPQSVLQKLRRSADGVDLQLLRADRVAGKEHIIYAAWNAVDSFRSKDRRAKKLSMEFLLFASGEHQIIEAIKLLGVTTTNPELVVVGLSRATLDPVVLGKMVMKTVGGTPDDLVLEIDTPSKASNLKRAFHISETEIESSRMPGESEESVLKRLVIERSALLALEN